MLRPMYLTGRNRTATDTKGTFYHLVEDDEYPNFHTALCGRKPGKRSNGWYAPQAHVDADCPKCIKVAESK